MDVIRIEERDLKYEQKQLDIVNTIKSQLFYVYGPELRVKHEERAGTYLIDVYAPRFKPSKFWGRGWGKMLSKKVLHIWYSTRASEFKQTLFIDVKKEECSITLEGCLRNLEKDLLNGDKFDRIRLEVE